jgi:Uma2 family endonuclease
MAVADAVDPPGVPAWWWDEFTDPPGYRAEIVQGELVLSPSPGRAHQRALRKLLRVLEDGCPEAFEVLPDIEWRLDRGGVVAQAPRPDLVVVGKVDGPIADVPLLAVEIVSRSDHRPLERSRRTRLEGKQLDYAQNGLQHLLVVSADAPWVQLLTPAPGGWAEVASGERDELFSVTEPFAFSLRPRELQ